MIAFYFFTIFIAISYFLNKKLGHFLIIVGLPILLIFLPTTGIDYEFYKESYDNSFFTSIFPYFNSISQLTAEPLYVWYTSVIAVITQISFPGFLALNYLICAFIIHYALNKTNVQSDITKYLFLYLLPVVIPTIFYFSPRSSISFAFIFLGFCTLFFNKKLFLGFIFLLIGFSFHSQFVLVSFYILTLYLMSRKSNIYSKFTIVSINLILAISLFLFLHFIAFFEQIIGTFFSFLPSASVAVSKLHYVSGTTEIGSDTFRMTAILSIVIYPLVLLFFLNKIDINNSLIDKSILFGITGIVFFGAAVNLAFMGDPHVAGRLSRFSDYFCMGFLIPYVLYINKNQLIIKIIALFMCIVAPFLFKSLYINAFEIF